MISGGKVRTVVDVADDVTPETLADMIARAVAFIQTYTRRYFGTPEEITEYITGNGNYNLRLSERVSEVDSDSPLLVTERCSPNDEAVEITAFDLRDAEGYVSVLRRTDGSVWGFGYEYAVTYTRGYDIDHGPKDIEQLIIDLLAVKFKLLTVGGGAMRSETAAGYSYTRFGESDLDAVSGGHETIDLWRRNVFA